MNFDNYPTTKEYLKQINMEDDVDKIIWLQMSKEEAAVALAKAYILSILINSGEETANLLAIAKNENDRMFLNEGKKLHGFTRDEALTILNMRSSDILRFYRTVAFK